MKRRVPWIDWKEWRDVFLLLFSQNEEAHLEGVRAIRIWEHRGRVPVSVEATGRIIEALDEAKRSGSQTAISALSLALVRLVNGLVEAQQRGSAPRAVSVIARQIGLPSRWVGLRHDTTHSGDTSAPSFVIHTAHEALSWLRYNYWDPQNEVAHESENLDANERTCVKFRDVLARCDATELEKILKEECNPPLCVSCPVSLRSLLKNTLSSPKVYTEELLNLCLSELKVPERIAHVMKKLFSAGVSSNPEEDEDSSSGWMALDEWDACPIGSFPPVNKRAKMTKVSKFEEEKETNVRLLL